jgi:glycosyltransferase involved in cell wall biosynthesis
MTKKIAILYPLFLGGGAELVTLWMIQALKDQYDVSLVTFSEENFKTWDRQFGTNLERAQITIRSPYASSPLFRNARKYSLFTIRQHLLASYYRKIEPEFDLGIAAFNEMDLGRAGIQYIHSPLFGHGNEAARRVFGYPASVSRVIYQRLCEWITGYSDARMKRNLTLTNSKWTADLIKATYGIESQVLYPPVILNPPDTPWVERENGFICSGRISPDKNLETVIEIIHQVRERGHNVHLHILGGNADPGYEIKIRKLCNQYPSWLSMEEVASRSELALILAKHRYGIHGRATETFGISVAEMACAGCIPFVPSGGGPAEIVEQDKRLVYRDMAEAIEKIVEILSHNQSASSISSSLRSKSAQYSLNRFNEELLKTVRKMILAHKD